MSVTTTTNKAAVVDKDYHWFDIKTNPPPNGPRMLLINRRYGVAVISNFAKDNHWTHWCPLPTFED